MSSTQGHSNINTVHTTIDISVLLGEINRIADDSYATGYDAGVKQGKADGYKQGESDGINIGTDICLALFRGWQTRLATNIEEFEDTLKLLKEQKNDVK